jgi:hypothetical protein
MAIMITYLCMPYDEKNAIKRKKKNKELIICLMSIATIKYIQDKKTYSSINKTKSYKCDLIKDMKTCVNHDGS